MEALTFFSCRTKKAEKSPFYFASRRRLLGNECTSVGTKHIFTFQKRELSKGIDSSTYTNTKNSLRVNRTGGIGDNNFERLSEAVRNSRIEKESERRRSLSAVRSNRPSCFTSCGFFIEETAPQAGREISRWFRCCGVCVPHRPPPRGNLKKLATQNENLHLISTNLECKENHLKKKCQR